MLVIESIDGEPLAVQPLINGGYNVITSDLLADGSGRSAETGEAIRYLIRKNMFKLNLKFKGEIEEISQVNSLVSRFTQTVKFNYLGTLYTVKMYPGDRNLVCGEFTAELSVNLIQE